MDAHSNGIIADQDTRRPIVEMNDKLMRVIGIPFFGILVPNISGLFGNLTPHDLNYWLGYPYFILLSAAIWQGNRYLMFRTRKRFTWFDSPVEKLLLLVINNVFYTSPLTVAWLCLWYRWAGFPFIHWEVVVVVTLINIICVLFVTHIYETVFMMKEQQNEQLLNAKLSASKAQAELEALRNQIDPHFMFNSLNSLTYLITTVPSKALQFTEHLAEIYRYILSQKDQSLVLLEDEMNFMEKYTALLALRFGNALRVTKHFSRHAEKTYLIPPISAFIAMENAVKHNEISEEAPLSVDLGLSGQYLTITNKIREKRSIRIASGIGLKNLDDRFRIITGKGITTENDSRYFKVCLPLMQLKN
jgi:sensor histidine kinase YesM